MTEIELKDHLLQFESGEERNSEANWLWQMNGICPQIVWDVIADIEYEETA